ncbi:MAG: HEPN domain-containing protein [Planctomycetota bacterium]|nr:HEPN domain-containing protein [Planctomycetota bacterium]
MAKLRVQEAQALFDAGLYNGAYYLAGYAIECALKACIAKQTQQHDFPDRQRAIDAWKHDLKELLRATGLAPGLDESAKEDPALQANWVIVKDWNVDSRYEKAMTQAEAQALIQAVTDAHKGILVWLQDHW